MRDVPGVYLLGPPGVGKTTLMHALTGPWQRLEPMVPGDFSPLRVEMLVDPTNGMVVGYHVGRTREKFGGTDALSYSVIDAACAWVSNPLAVPLYAEGARLAHSRFASACAAGGNDLVWFLLDAPDDLLDARCAERGSDQNVSWRHGAGTRARNAATRLRDAGVAVHTLDATLSVDDLALAVREVAWPVPVSTPSPPPL